MKKPLSPQEKKRLSYKRDRRNDYGERGSHSRHAIAKHKARAHRAFRRQVAQVLSGQGIHQPELREEVDVEAKSVAASSWRKSPDGRLGEVVQRKLERRARVGINVEVKETLFQRGKVRPAEDT